MGRFQGGKRYYIFDRSVMWYAIRHSNGAFVGFNHTCTLVGCDSVHYLPHHWITMAPEYSKAEFIEKATAIGLTEKLLTRLEEYHGQILPSD